MEDNELDDGIVLGVTGDDDLSLLTDEEESDSNNGDSSSESRSSEPGEEEDSNESSINSNDSEFESETDSEIQTTSSSSESMSEPEEQAKFQRTIKRQKGTAKRSRQTKKSRPDKNVKAKSPKRRQHERVIDSSSGDEDELMSFKEVRCNPKLKNLIKKLTKNKGGAKSSHKKSAARGTDKTSTRKKGREKFKKEKGKRKEGMKNKVSSTNVVRSVKSPSEPSLYKPILNKISKKDSKQKNVPSTFSEDKIDRILSQLRLGNSSVNDISGKDRMRYEEANPEEKRSSGKEAVFDPGAEAIIQAEKFKAAVERPEKGELKSDLPNNAGPVKQGIFDNDIDSDEDDIFQIACHVDSVTRAKIQRGEYVDLEKLIPRPFEERRQEQDDSIDMVSKDGQHFILPVKKKSKYDRITGIKKWDEAFRIYLAIYSQANPERSAEIMQYQHTIHTAAVSFIWENVAQYDFLFRTRLGKKPGRNWARMNTQLWAMCMTTNRAVHTSNVTSSSNSSKKDCCWRYNRNKCTRPNDCKFEHRCSQCGSFSHIYLNCPNKPKKGDHKDKHGKEKKKESTPKN